jgi:NADPH2:quinone reductase
MTELMRAISIRDGGRGHDALCVASVPSPVVRTGQVLIRVRAAGVNRPDILQRQGLYPPPPGASDILGLEVAGEVAAVGEGVDGWSPGDRVVALLAGGGYAEYALVDARHLLPIPPGLDFITAAGLPETVFTVWTNVFERGQLKAGETFLVHGANSGIGVTAIQMAKAAGARVFATARGAVKTHRALEIGADVAVDAHSQDWSQVIKSAGGVDVLLDMVGADYFQRNIEVLGQEGRLVIIAFLTGNEVRLNLQQLMVKRVTLTGSTLRARDADEKARLTRAVQENAWPWIEKGLLNVPVDKTFPLERAGDAHKWLESGSQFGKVILTMD